MYSELARDLKGAVGILIAIKCLPPDSVATYIPSIEATIFLHREVCPGPKELDSNNEPYEIFV